MRRIAQPGGRRVGSSLMLATSCWRNWLGEAHRHQALDQPRQPAAMAGASSRCRLQACPRAEIPAGRSLHRAASAAVGLIHRAVPAAELDAAAAAWPSAWPAAPRAMLRMAA